MTNDFRDADAADIAELRELSRSVDCVASYMQAARALRVDSEIATAIWEDPSAGVEDPHGDDAGPKIISVHETVDGEETLIIGQEISGPDSPDEAWIASPVEDAVEVRR